MLFVPEYRMHAAIYRRETGGPAFAKSAVSIMSDRFWIFDWLDEQRIRSLADAEVCLQRKDGLDSTICKAQTWKPASDTASSRRAIVAGTGLDLGFLSCQSPDCQRAQIDKLFSRVWFYFDKVVVQDELTPFLANAEGVPRVSIVESVLEKLPAILHLVEIGATDLVCFQTKVLCSHDKHFHDAGLDSLLPEIPAIVATLIRDGTFDFSHLYDNSDSISLEHPELAMRAHHPRHPTESLEKQKAELAEGVVRDHLATLVGDVLSSHKNKLPLGCTIGFHGRLLRRASNLRAEEVIFNLSLPFLNGVLPTTLMEIRKEEAESFDRFRKSLREAAHEVTQARGHSDPSEIAEEVRLDIIEPALTSIRQRLSASERTLAKKAVVGVFLGTLATTCGLLAGVPGTVAVGLGMGAVLPTIGSAAQKFLDEERDISLQDMYFLWKAIDHAH